MLRSTCSVILSEQSESKDLRTFRFASRHSVRRSFDFGLRPSLRMTNGAAAPIPSPGETPQGGLSCPSGNSPPGGPRRGSGEEFGRKPESQYNLTILHQGCP